MENASPNKALWGGRFEAQPAEFLQRYGASLPFDKRMWAEDIQGSKAHAKMLAQVGVISQEDADAIRAGLDEVGADIAAGNFDFDINDEDIHMSVERSLTQRIGAAGGRLHTGRSRNDQVALDDRLIARRLCRELHAKVCELREALLERAEGEFGVVMPGYTHMQKAQPVLFSHHMLAYYWMDSVSDRDFFLDLLYACSVAQMHLSRLCEELVYWSSDEFRFITMDDTYSTGSSIMPQKKNPDFAELTRGKTGRVYGDLVSLLTTMKGIPLAYNKDMQEDKEPVFDAADTVADALHVCAGMIRTMRVNRDNMRAGGLGGFMAATDLADYLVGKGMPFREAHSVIGHMVLSCEKAGKRLQDLTLDELKQFSELFDEGAFEATDIDKVVERRTTAGGTGHEPVRVQIAQAKEALAADQAWGK